MIMFSNDTDAVCVETPVLRVAGGEVIEDMDAGTVLCVNGEQVVIEFDGMIDVYDGRDLERPRNADGSLADLFFFNVTSLVYNDLCGDNALPMSDLALKTTADDFMNFQPPFRIQA